MRKLSDREERLFKRYKLGIIDIDIVTLYYKKGLIEEDFYDYILSMEN